MDLARHKRKVMIFSSLASDRAALAMAEIHSRAATTGST